jgi:hypothetical protein
MKCAPNCVISLLLVEYINIFLTETFRFDNAIILFYELSFLFKYEHYH